MRAFACLLAVALLAACGRGGYEPRNIPGDEIVVSPVSIFNSAELQTVYGNWDARWP